MWLVWLALSLLGALAAAAFFFFAIIIGSDERLAGNSLVMMSLVSFGAAVVCAVGAVVSFVRR